MKNPYSSVYLDDGLGEASKARYLARRQALMGKTQGLTVISGVPTGPNGTSTWAHLSAAIFQEPLFLFLTGINQPNCMLILDPEHAPHEVLFLDEKNPKKEFWDGAKFGFGSEADIQFVCEQTGLQAVMPRSMFEQVLHQKLALDRTHHHLWTFWNSAQNGQVHQDANHAFKLYLDHWLSQAKLTASYDIQNCAKLAFSCRFPLDQTDHDNIKIANQKTNDCFLSTLKKLPSFNSEREVSGYLNGQIQMTSQFGNSFPSIVAAGKNATVLHYTKNDDPIDENELILLDFGVRWQGMHADVTRTVPAKGTFNPLQKMVYRIVLDAQTWVESQVRPGATLSEINEGCWEFILDRLDRDIQQKGGFVELPYAKAPHNVSHLIGLQVHDGDPFREYKTMPMEPGWLISNEPGIYGHFKLMIDGRLYQEDIGIRIEDDLWVTESGCENLTPCPKTIEEIEACY